MTEDDIEWRLKMEKRLSTTETTVEALDHVLNGNGQVGFVQEIRDYVSEQRGAWKMMGLIGGVIAFVLVVLQIWAAYRDLQRKTEINPGPTIGIVHQHVDAAMPEGMTWR